MARFAPAHVVAERLGGRVERGLMSSGVLGVVWTLPDGRIVEIEGDDVVAYRSQEEREGAQNGKPFYMAKLTDDERKKLRSAIFGC